MDLENFSVEVYVLFLLGIILHTFSVSYMRNNRFNDKLSFTSQNFKSSPFTSDCFTSSRFSGLLSVVHVFVVFILQVCIYLVRVSHSPVQSSPRKYIFEQ